MIYEGQLFEKANTRSDSQKKYISLSNDQNQFIRRKTI